VVHFLYELEKCEQFSSLLWALSLQIAQTGPDQMVGKLDWNLELGPVIRLPYLNSPFMIHSNSTIFSTIVPRVFFSFQYD